MSFSSEIKEELSRNIPRARHCQIAEIAAMLSFNEKKGDRFSDRKCGGCKKMLYNSTKNI